MAIILPSGFDITNVDPIDSRFSVATQAARLGFSAANVYEGLVVYQRDTNELYVLTNTGSYNSVAGWELVGTPTGSFATTGSNRFNGNQIITGSVTSTLGFTGSLQGTASFAATASYILPLSQNVIISGSLKLDPTQDPDPTGTDLDSTVLFQSSSNNALGYDLYVRQNGNLVKWKWIEGSLETGLLYGGAVTYSGSNVFISPGSGIIVDHNATTGSEVLPMIEYVTWNAITQSITNIATQQVTYLYIDNNGALQQQSTRFTSQQYHNYIPLGAVGHFDYTQVSAFGGGVQTAYDQGSQTSNFIDAFGPLKVSGYGLTGQAGSLRLSVGSGTSFIHGGFYQNNPEFPSQITTPSQATASIARVQRSGSAIEFDTNAGNFYTVVDPTKYDRDGDGTLANVGSGNWSIQRVFSDPKTGILYVYYGQARYTSLLNALQFLPTDPFTEGDTFDFTTFVGFLVLKGNASDITDTSNNSIINGGLFRGSGQGSGGGIALSNLEDLTDVSITSPTNGQALIYNSGTWINGDPLNATSASRAISSSYALTASYADNFTVAGTITAQKLVVQTITSSIVYSSGSNQFGSQLTDVQSFTGSLRVTGSGNHYVMGGNVGIGTSNPTYKLHISSSNNNDSLAIHYIANDSTLFPFIISSNTDTAGNYVRINTAIIELKRAGAASTIRTVGSANPLNLQTDTGDIVILPNQIETLRVGPNALNISGSVNISGSGTQIPFQITSGSTSLMFVSQSGNIGIGTSSPLTSLDIRASSNTTITPLASVPNTATTLLIGNTGTNGVLAIGHNNTGQPWLQGRSRLAGQAAEDILINPLGGNVGIGTINPTNTLDIFSNATGSLRISGSGGSQITLVRPTAGLSGFIRYVGGTMEMGTIGADGLTFRSNNIVRLTLGATGNIDVAGNTTIQGSSATTGNALVVSNSTPISLYTIQNNGQQIINSPIIVLNNTGSAFNISHNISHSAVIGAQVYGINYQPTFFGTTGSQTETAFRINATFTGSAVATGGTNIITDFGSNNSGTQFSVTDVISGSIYMVNDVSGLPIIEATSDWGVKIWDFPKVVLEKTGSVIKIDGTLQITGSSIITGSLTVTQGITGSLFGTSSFAQTSSFATSASFAQTASFVNTLRQNVIITGSLQITGSSIITGSLEVRSQTFIPTGSIFVPTNNFTSLFVSNSLSQSISYNITNGSINYATYGDPIHFYSASIYVIAKSNQYNSATSTGFEIVETAETIQINFATASVQSPATITGYDIYARNHINSTWYQNTYYASNPNITFLNITDGSFNSGDGWNTTSSLLSLSNNPVPGYTTLNTVGIGKSSSLNGVLDVNGNTIITGSFTVTTGSNIEFQVTNTGVKIGNILTDTHTITGSLNITGSVVTTGSIVGNVTALTISSNTASLNLNNGNFFTLQLVPGVNTHINPTNIKAGQTINILVATTGSATVSFPSTVLQSSGFLYVPTVTTGSDILTMVSFNTSSLYLANVKNLV
jgi:hypothetical protein